jgi:hypothetical protein
MFRFTTLCNIVIKVEAHRSRNGLTQCYNYQIFGHIWVHCRHSPRYCSVGVDIAIMSAQRNKIESVSQPAAIATSKTGNSRTQQVTEAAIVAQKEPTGDSREHVLLEICNT